MFKTLSYKLLMFKKVYFEISNICNLKCSFCPQTSKKKEYVSLNDFKKVANELKDYCEQLCPHILGEPLTHPHILEIFQICQDLNLALNISTNGVNINIFKEAILKFKIIKQINFSLHCFSDNFPHESIESYLKNILNFCILANKLRPSLYINLRLWNHDEHEQNNEQILIFIETFLKIKIKRSVDIRSIKYKKISDNIRLHFDTRFQWPSIDLINNGNTGNCYGLKTHFGILVDGTVVPCCLDKDGIITLGNCFSDNLKNIFISDRFTKIKNGFEKRILVEKLCQHCSFINRFKKY